MADHVDMLHAWHEFYLLLGTAAAALLALLFVAVSIGVGFFTDKGAAATRVYISPVVVHFASLLFLSAVALAPAKPSMLLVMMIGAAGVAGAGVGFYTTLRVFADRSARVVAFDRFAYGLVPVFAYLTITAASILIAAGWEWSPHLLAGAMLLLLLINIRNAWDLMLTVVRRQGRRR